MSLPIKWYADGRVLRRRSELKSGLTNPFLNNADLVELNDLIYQIAYGIVAGTPTGPINVSNGLTSTITPTSNDITLGGLLTNNTTIDGAANTYSLSVANLSTFGVDADLVNIVAATSGVFIDTQNADITFITANGAINFDSAGLGAASNGHVWTLVDNSTGEGEWTPLPSNTPEANNGLNVDGIYTQLGGTLVENTTIDGNSFQYDLSLLEIVNFNLESNVTTITTDEFTVDAVNNINLVSTSDLTLESPSTFFLKSPNYSTAAERQSALTIVDSATGEADFYPINHFPITTVITNASVNSTVHTVLADAAANGGTISVNLPQASINEGMMVNVKLITAGTLTIESTGSGVTPIYTTAASPDYVTAVLGETVRLHCNGTYWFVL